MKYLIPADWHPLDTQDPASTQLSNERRLLDVLLRSKAPTTQAEVIRRTGLSRSTVATIIDRLNEAELLERDQDVLAQRAQLMSPAQHSGVGRPPTFLALAPRSGVAIGVDFGHRHLRVAVASADGVVRAEEEIRMTSDGELLRVTDHPLTSLSLATQLVTKLTAQVLRVDASKIDSSKIVGLAVGLPGPVDLMRGVPTSSSVMANWRGIKPADELRKRLRWVNPADEDGDDGDKPPPWSVPALIENDATLAAVCEHERGVLRGIADCIYVKWATGIGGAIILDGAIRRGTRGLAGELGHLPVPAEIPPERRRECPQCGRHCLQSVAGGDAIVEQVAGEGQDDVDALVEEWNESSDGPRIDVQPGNPLRDVIELCKRGNPDACRALDQAAYYVGATLGSLVTLLNPRTIVIGGSFEADAYPLITDGLRRGLSGHGLSTALNDLELKTGDFTGRAAVRGAIALVLGTELANFLGHHVVARSSQADPETSTPEPAGADRKRRAVSR